MLPKISDIIGVWKLIGKFEDATDPWENVEYKFSPRIFGRGSTHKFGWYLEGKGETVDGLDGIVELLLNKFRYKSDKELFGKKDYWQHPSEFAERCQGDCEDHALWVWRKLKENNIRARFIGGKLCRNKPGFSFHAWVVFNNQGVDYSFETIAKEKEKMILPLHDKYVNEKYIPLFGVDHELRTYGYAGIGIMAKKFSFKEIFDTNR